MRQLGPTKPATLVVVGLAGAAVAWLLISRFYASLPSLPWLPAVALAILALAEGVAAVTTRAWIQRRPRRGVLDPLLVARFVVLAKASSLVGAIFGGFYAGLLVWLVFEPTRAATRDVPATAAGLGTSLALVAAALWLERSCRVPKRPEDENEPGERRR